MLVINIMTIGLLHNTKQNKSYYYILKFVNYKLATVKLVIPFTY